MKIAWPFPFPASNPTRTLRDWFSRPRPALGEIPDFGTLHPNLLHWPNFNGSYAPTVPQVEPVIYNASKPYGGQTSILIPRPGPMG